jgi:hypothetical protein
MENVVRARDLALSMLFLFGCRAVPAGLPVEDRVSEIEELDRATAPPLYQYMYDSAFLPEVQAVEQRTRILVWLRYVELDPQQLRMLLRLHERAGVLRERLESSQRRIVERYEPGLVPVYEEIYGLLASGAALDDPRLGDLSAELAEARTQRLRDDELLAIRMQSVRALLDEEQALLRTLSPQQEAIFPDVVFTLRRELDLAASSGDFRSLIGSIYSVGDPTLLLRGDYELSREHLDIGGLWADDAKTELSGPVLHQARRELLLYLLLQEPALPEAVEAALAVAGADPDEPGSPSVPGDAALPADDQGGPENGVRPPPGAEPLPAAGGPGLDAGVRPPPGAEPPPAGR